MTGELHIDPKSKNAIVVRSSGDNTASNSMPRIEITIKSNSKGDMLLSFRFPQIDDPRDALKAQNTIFVSEDGDIRAKKCIAEEI